MSINSNPSVIVLNITEYNELEDSKIFSQKVFLTREGALKEIKKLKNEFTEMYFQGDDSLYLAEYNLYVSMLGDGPISVTIEGFEAPLLG